MSTALAIAAVTAVLKDLLNDGLINGDLSSVIGSNVTVTALPPDRIPTSNSDERSQLNLFLYQVSPNLGWRNVGLPSRDAQGERLTNPPLALDLHYLLTAYGAQDFHAEILLGYAMQLLHETPVLPRDAIRTTLNPPLSVSGSLPPTFQAIAASDLADQIEQIKICQQFPTTEEFSKLWTSFQAHYRPTAVYHVSVVLIEGARPTRSALPVLTRGITTQANLIPPFPTLEQVRLIDLATNALLAEQRMSFRIGEKIAIIGHHLAGESGDPIQVTLTVRLTTTRLPDPLDHIIPGNDRTDKRIDFQIPYDPVKYPVGFYTLEVLVAPNGRPKETRTTNELPLLIAPTIAQINGSALPVPPDQPISAARVKVINGLGDVTLNIQCSPEVLPEQPAMLLIGDLMVNAEAHTDQTNTLTFKVKRIPAGTYRLRLRIDGVDSLLVDVSNPDRPKFDETQKVTIT